MAKHFTNRFCLTPNMFCKAFLFSDLCKIGYLSDIQESPSFIFAPIHCGNPIIRQHITKRNNEYAKLVFLFLCKNY